MKTTTVLNVLHVIAWIIFIGLCINAGTLLVSAFVSIFINAEAAKNLYLGLDLSGLYQFGNWYYLSAAISIIVLAGLKAYLFYWVIQIFSKINFEQPFSENVALLISRISRIALEIGIVSLILNGYAKWLAKQGPVVSLANGSGEFLYLAGILFVVAQIYKRGIEIQSENELTV